MVWTWVSLITFSLGLSHGWDDCAVFLGEDNLLLICFALLSRLSLGNLEDNARGYL